VLQPKAGRVRAARGDADFRRAATAAAMRETLHKKPNGSPLPVIEKSSPVITATAQTAADTDMVADIPPDFTCEWSGPNRGVRFTCSRPVRDLALLAFRALDGMKTLLCCPM